MEKDKLEQQRQILRSLHRRELQARAKALGVRANGKTVDIIESLARILAGLGTPRKPHESLQRVVNTGIGDSRIAAPDDSAPVTGDGAETGSSDSNAREGTPLAHDTPSNPAAQQLPNTSSPDESNNPPVMLDIAAPMDSQSSASPATRDTDMPTAGREHEARRSPVSVVPAVAQSTPVPSLLPPAGAAATTPSVAELAARATAATLAARMNSMHIDSILKTKALAAKGAPQHPAPAENSLSDADSPCRALDLDLQALVPHAFEPCKPGADLEVKADDVNEVGAAAPASPVRAPQGASIAAAGDAAMRQLTFDPNASLAAGVAAAAAVAAPEALAAADPAAVSASSSNSGSGSITVASEPAGALTVGAPSQFRSCRPSSSAVAAAGSRGAQSDSMGRKEDEHDPTPAPGPAVAAAVSQLAFPTAVAGVMMPRLVTPHPVAGDGGGTSKVTAVHVTARTPLRQQRLHGLGVAPVGLTVGAITPQGRAMGAAPRTPGLGLRTPARRVPVCADEAQARAMDEWVRQHLLFAAGQLQHNSKLAVWRDLVGLRAAKEQLLAVCFGPPASEQPSRNAAVLVCGPPGVGKAILARALAAELGATYLHVPPDLGSRSAPAGGGSDTLLRAVFRVASQVPAPVVVHVEDAELLAGAEAGRLNESCRRARTELLVGVDELLLQSAAAGPTYQNTPANSTCITAVGSGGAPRVKVLVLSTSSRPMDLDAMLAASLGRTERLMVALPDPEAREAYLVGRLASDGAALGVEQVDRIVRETHGWSCGELAAMCDAAVAAAAARRMAPEDGGAVSEQDMDTALKRFMRSITPQEVAELEQWHSRAWAAQPRLGQR